MALLLQRVRILKNLIDESLSLRADQVQLSQSRKIALQLAAPARKDRLLNLKL